MGWRIMETYGMQDAMYVFQCAERNSTDPRYAAVIALRASIRSHGPLHEDDQTRLTAVGRHAPVGQARRERPAREKPRYGPWGWATARVNGAQGHPPSPMVELRGRDEERVDTAALARAALDACAERPR